jgi:hypothetical protein
MATHKNNCGAVIRDIGKVTFDTLDEFKIPYDELIFGKPIADVYIDDRAVNPYLQTMESLGIFSDTGPSEQILNKLNNNLHNHIQRNGNTIIKSGNQLQLEGEIYYYTHLPESLKAWHPNYISHTISPYSLTMEYIEGIPFTLLWKEGLLCKRHIDMIFVYFDSIHTVKSSTISDNEVANNYVEKLKYRFEVSEHYPFKDATIYQTKILEHLERYIQERRYHIVSFIHGDCWFGNILLTYQDTIRCIDMRGRWGNKHTMSGDALYDYAKIYQSILGYDTILFNYSNTTLSEEIKKYFLECCEQRGILERDIRLITLSLLIGSFWSIPKERYEDVWNWLTHLDWNL